MIKYHNIEQGSIEWLALRADKVTASHANTIAVNGRGLETYIKNKKTSKSFKGNVSTERGNILESMAVGVYEKTVGEILKEGNAPITKIGAITNSKYPIALASPDRLIGDDGLMEVKCFEKKEFLKIDKSKKIPKKVLYQMQMQLMISEREWNEFVLFHPEYPMLIITIYPDQDIFAELKLGLKACERLMRLTYK